MKKQRSIKVNIKNGAAHADVPATFGVPFPIGQVTALHQLSMANDIPFAASTLSTWHDGSIKWAHLRLVLPASTEKLQLDISEQQVSNPKLVDAGIQISETEHGIYVESGEQTFYVSKDQPTLPQICEAESPANKNIQANKLATILSDEHKNQYLAKGHKLEYEQYTCPHSNECISLVVKVSGIFVPDKINFTYQYTFYFGSPYIEFILTLHNPQAAVHEAGQWDLGDPHSFPITGLSLPLNFDESTEVELCTNFSDKIDVTGKTWHLSQYSSGGGNWQSPVHLDKNNQLNLPHKNAQLVIDNQSSSELIRPTPQVIVKDPINNLVTQFAFPNFWQCFPNKISGNKNTIALDAFPADSGGNHELQAGEKYTKKIWIGVSQDNQLKMDWVYAMPIIHLEENWYQSCDVTTGLSVDQENVSQLQSLVDLGLDSDNGFFAKREQIDEFGWRNFGDLYADHETASYTGNELFVSHYNNQYDPLFGFIRQFLSSGEPCWLELANDLAQHVKNIDIYYTDQDKAEYNGGLFWHTDHYVKAHTSSHRSYSRLQEDNAYQDHAGGGGPGGQHCYTTGLSYHYFLTGEKSSKEAVLTLTNWITSVYEGTGTCLELLLAVKNRHVAGLKNQITGQYPFDRGTAHYVVALLDSYNLTQDTHYLTQVEHVIRNTIHPNDNISERDLANVEECWFYTVFLQAVCRYLGVKMSENTFDPAFYYARDALLHYANWMLKNEYPYLDKPDVLEYPNDTWTAQDLRKVQIFAAAWYYSPENSEGHGDFLEKAEYFQDYVVNKLKSSSERYYTRILALLMQNSGTLEYYRQANKPVEGAISKRDWPSAPYMTTGFIVGFVKQLFKRIHKFSLTNEYTWLKKRIGK